MQNILKKIVKTITTTVTVGFVGCVGFWIGQQQERVVTTEIIESQQDYLTDEAVTLSHRELEIFYLAQALYGEAKGQPDEWETMTTAVFNRVDQTWTPATLIGTLLQKDRYGRCQIVAMCDTVPEDLTSVIGQAAVAHAQVALEQHALGTYERTHVAHSWATPAAADSHSYFEDLRLIIEESGHQFFGDISYAPEVSLRPQARPADPILLALMEAQK